jgi:hypothetical protein
MADRNTIMAGVWDCMVEEWNAGNVERARSLERFYTALEERDAHEAAATAGDGSMAAEQDR